VAKKRKTKIVFVTRKMVMGGIEKALIAMLENLPKELFDTTLVIMEPGGDLIEKIPKHVKIKYLFANELRLYKRVWRYINNGKLKAAFDTTFYTILLKYRVKSVFKENVYVSKVLPIMEGKYDLAIAYHIPTSFPVTYVANNINAKKKIAWIHSDVSDSDEEFKINNDGNKIRYSDDDPKLKYPDLLKRYIKIYEKYDKIFCVSQYAARKFNNIFPHLTTKTSVFYNIVDKKKIKLLSRSNESYSDPFSGIRILTVGRLGWEKGQDSIPDVLLKLKSDGYNVRWYCIGEGDLSGQLEYFRKKYSLEDHLILLGKKSNPYPYIRDCDLYVQPSRQEGYCITIAEARAFNKPVITTKTGASEQVINEETGLIVNFNKNEMYEAIKRLIDDEYLRGNIIKNLSMENIDTTKEIEKMYDMIEHIS